MLNCRVICGSKECIHVLTEGQLCRPHILRLICQKHKWLSLGNTTNEFSCFGIYKYIILASHNSKHGWNNKNGMYVEVENTI